MHTCMSVQLCMCFNWTGNQDLLGVLEYQLGQLQLQPQLAGVPIPMAPFPAAVQLPPVQLLQFPNQVYIAVYMCLLYQL